MSTQTTDANVKLNHSQDSQAPVLMAWLSEASRFTIVECDTTKLTIIIMEGGRMTSNTIAYASYKEDQRHNLMFEEETNRHNTVVESLEKERLQIEDFRVRAEAQYKRESNRIQEAYNNAYIQLQTAQGQRKLDIESQLADLEAEKKDITAQWYQDQADVNRRNAYVNEQKLAEDIRYHNITSVQTDKQIELNQQKLRFDKYAFNESNQLKKEELDIARSKTSLDYELRNAALRLDESRLKLDKEKQPYTIDLLKADTWAKNAQGNWSQTSVNYKKWDLIYGLVGNTIRSMK